MRLSHLACLVLLLPVGTACQEPSGIARPVFFEIVVESDPGVRLGSVPIQVDGESLGQTSSDGVLRTPILSAPGRVHTVTHDCPADHVSPRGSTSIRVRQYASHRPGPIQIKLECRPLVRVAAFIVRAKNGAGLPVRVNGELVATTNRFGVAHFSESGPAGTEYLVEVDASGQPGLRPRSAMKLVTAPDSDELFILAPTFQLPDRAKKPRLRRRRIIKIE